jgi:hypothetical protein
VVMGFISFVIFCYTFLLVSVHSNRDSCCSLWILAIFSDLLVLWLLMNWHWRIAVCGYYACSESLEKYIDSYYVRSHVSVLDSFWF